MRIMLAVLLAPIAVPVCFRMILPFYIKGSVTEQSVPLLPDYQGMMLYLSYLVTLLIGLPAWSFIRRRWRVTIFRSSACGVLFGLAAASMYLSQLTWPAGLLLWTGGLGGGLTAMLFVLIAGKQPNPSAPDRSLNSVG